MSTGPTLSALGDKYSHGHHPTPRGVHFRAGLAVPATRWLEPAAERLTDPDCRREWSGATIQTGVVWVWVWQIDTQNDQVLWNCPGLS